MRPDRENYESNYEKVREAQETLRFEVEEFNDPDCDDVREKADDLRIQNDATDDPER